MDALTQQLVQQLDGDGLSQIDQQIGADEQATGSALSAAMGFTRQTPPQVFTVLKRLYQTY